MPKLTKHSISRLKERCGVTKKNAPKVARRAYTKGIKHSQTTGNLHRYLDTLYLSQRNGTNMRIYGDSVFVFREDTLITVINLPNNLLKEIKGEIR